jgi:hypothetical protein
MQAVVEKHGDAFVVMVAGLNRGTFTTKADAQLWALHLIDTEHIEAAVLLSGLVIFHNR